MITSINEFKKYINEIFGLADIKNTEAKFLNKKVITTYGTGTIYKISEPSSAEADKTPNLHLKLDKPIQGSLIKNIDTQIIKLKDIKTIL